jgi:beta-aspartyl-peptidase (threonine type)
LFKIKQIFINFFLPIFFILSIVFGCKPTSDNSNDADIAIDITEKQQKKTNDFAIIIHGGAGTILKKNMSDEKEIEYKAKLEEAIRTGHDILKNGVTSQEAVMKTIQIMGIPII